MNPVTGKIGKDLDTTFVIPKKASVNDVEQKPTSNTVLADAYANDEQKTPKQVSVPDIPSIYTHQIPIPWSRFYEKVATIANTSTTNWESNQQKRTWMEANSSTGNTTISQLKYKDTFGDLNDASLPKELLSQFQPLFCKLCMIQLSSRSMAKLHYKSKNHDKHIRAWLLEYAEQTGEPIHKRAVIPRLKKGEEYEPKFYHCEICDLALNGKMHAESHYMGKPHQRALNKVHKPSGKGFFDEDEKWVRTVAAKDDPTGRDGFGQDFAKKELAQKSVPPALQCEICDITVTSASQMTMHMEGSKHKKKLKQSKEKTGSPELYDPMEESDLWEGEDLPEPVPETPDELCSYRTPSGNFYCKMCNVSLNSEVQFVQHLHSKKHAKKSAQPAPAHREFSVSGAPTSADDLFMHL